MYHCVPLCTPMYPCVPLALCIPMYVRTNPSVKKEIPPLIPPLFKLRRAPVRDANLRRFSSSDRSAEEGGVRTEPLVVLVAARGTGAFGGRARAGRVARCAGRFAKERKKLISPKPRKIPLAVVKTFCQRGAKMRPSQSSSASCLSHRA